MVFESRSMAEAGVVEYLRKHLKAPYEVIPSTDYASIGDDKRLHAGEFDALLFHPAKGILVIEVKGGGVAYDGNTRKWFSIDQQREKHLIKDPFKQARKAAECLRRDISERCAGAIANPAAIPVGYAVFLPDVNVGNITLPLHAPKEVIADSSDMLHVADRIASIMGHFMREGFRGLTPTKTSALRARVLYPTCCVMPTLKSQIEKEEVQIVAMTEEQVRLLDGLYESRQVAIKGYAGSGKTMLAVEKARRLYHHGLSVVVCCFNKPISESIRSALIDCSDRVHVSTFHGLVWKLCNDAGIALGEAPEDGEAAKAFWDEDTPLMMLEAISKTGARYDAIVVDEGQDFRPDWFDALKELLKDKQDGYFYIFFDPKQAIYCDETRFPVPVSDFVLRTNCRNTKSICRLACDLGGVDMVLLPGAPVGEPPAFMQYASAEDQIAKIEDCVRDLTDRGGLGPGDLACLSTHSRPKSCLSKVTDLAGFPVTEELMVPDEAIRFSSLHRFKGLEADVILLCDVDGDPDNCRPEHLYVGVSRAKHRVHLFHSPEWAPPN